MCARDGSVAQNIMNWQAVMSLEEFRLLQKLPVTWLWQAGREKKKNLDRKKKYLLENKWISRTSKLQVAKFHYPLFSRGIAEEIYTCWKHPPSLQHISKSQLTCNTGKDAPGSKSVSRSALLHDIGTPQVALGSQLCTPTFWTPCIAQQTCHLSLHQAASLGFATVGLTHCFFPADCGYWE